MQLTPKQREVWIMVELENLPQTEVARRTGRSPESVCRLLSRAKLAIDPLLIAFDAAGGDRSHFRRLLTHRMSIPHHHRRDDPGDAL